MTLFQPKKSEQKRKDLKKKIASGTLLRFPGSFSPLVSRMIEKQGFDGVYISGSVLAADQGLPDIGLTTLTEVAGRGRVIARATGLPAIIDMDTGFGETMNVARTIQELEEFGLCGAHMEDQVNPKRCGHLDNKALIDSSLMSKKIQAAALARSDDNFLIIARTDARAVEGLHKAIDRAKAYLDAGADMIFPEALADIQEFEKFRREIKAPLLANMTEFGKSPLLGSGDLESLGYNLVIYPVSTFRLAMKAVEDGLAALHHDGTQEHLLDKMQTRSELYEVLQYRSYNQFDQEIYNFDL